ncbi:helix-turn-helix transcriptional regulator [Actinokineospora bangkokensis]|uniref:AraC family transcriptional regulator n=1 Tax=Actinokineospora bangkokensis TaxID=1193682 RepID=A0A1Q9LL76_9PSEU|nr:AraC family transcriptional regulator [Actinokineospora bangkokensis]OLR92792.1 AraC family transcriptional regulator [Actinokineospora bangkokensis]
MPERSEVAAWRPDLPGVREVLHARFAEHAYPAHTHDAWTVLIIDSGAVRYDLDHHEHGALTSHVTLLPPHVPHDGRNATAEGFGKRVLYLETDVLDPGLAGAAVDSPALADRVLRARLDQLHRVLAPGRGGLEAESRLALIRERLGLHLDRRATPAPAHRDPGLARRLRDLLDANTVPGVALADASAALHAHPVHLVRAFSAEFGLPPHRYLTGRRVDLARRLLLDGVRPAEVAAAAGFYDQSHLTRHFKRMLGVPPSRFRG